MKEELIIGTKLYYEFELDRHRKSKISNDTKRKIK